MFSMSPLKSDIYRYAFCLYNKWGIKNQITIYLDRLELNTSKITPQLNFWLDDAK